MKGLRLSLWLLIALLLPLRGAVAASMPCEGPVVPVAALQTTAEHAHHHDSHDAPKAHATAETCHLCAASCAMTPLPVQAPSLQPAALAWAWRFPPLLVPAAHFVSEGPERPPRG